MAQISLDRTRQNFAYTSIYSPIDGVIVSRSVELGQTVAASLSTPEIFRIAESLTEMQILASVDESDIGRIAVDQRVTFTVSAFPAQTFRAKLLSDRQTQTVALEVRRAFLDYQAALEQINATRAQQQASDLALTAVQERYRVGAATLVELTVARAAQVTAASALVNARYSLIFQQSLMSFFTGTLDPATISFGAS